MFLFWLFYLSLTTGACYTCEEGWTTILDTCYYVSTRDMNFSAAAADCHKKNSSLYEPDSAGAQLSIIMYLQPQIADFTPYLGIRRTNSR